MKLKEAIELATRYRFMIDTEAGHSEVEKYVAFGMVLHELRASQKRERDVWKALSRQCCLLSNGINCVRNAVRKCQRSTCPLLKGCAK